MGAFLSFLKFLRFCLALLSAVGMSLPWLGWFRLFPIEREARLFGFSCLWTGVAVLTATVLYLTAQHGRLGFGRTMAFAAGLGIAGVLPAFASAGAGLAGITLAASLAAALIAWRALSFSIKPDMAVLDQLSAELKHLNGFAEHYRKTLEKWMLGQEGERAKAIPRLWIGISIALPAAALMTGALDYYVVPQTETFDWFFETKMNTEDIIVLGFFLVSSLLGTSFAAYPCLELQEKMKGKMLDSLLNFFEDLSYTEKLKGFDSKKFSTAGLVAPFTRHETGEAFTGKYGHISFTVVQNTLIKITKSEEVETETPVFDGLMILLTFPKSFSGHTLVLKDGKDAPLERVNLVHSSFERLYEVFSTNQIEARAVLTPDLMWNMTLLGEAFQGKNRIGGLRAMDEKTLPSGTMDMAFKGHDLLMTIETTGDPFEIGHLDSGMADTARIARFAREVALIYEIVDTLELNRKAGGHAA